MLFDEESSGNCVAFSVYCRQGMFAGSGLQGNFVEILRLCLIGVVKMPEDSRIGVTVCQFDREKPFTAVQLFGQLDMGVHRRVDELHGLERIFSTAGFERMAVVCIPDGAVYSTTPIRVAGQTMISEW